MWGRLKIMYEGLDCAKPDCSELDHAESSYMNKQESERI
jgi:hypothetical protein